MDLNLFKELERKNVSHWAEELQPGDRCIATIRHQTDGSNNIHGANVIVIENNHKIKSIKGWFDSTEHIIPYNELKPFNDHSAMLS